MSDYKALFTADWQLCNSLPHALPGERGVTDRLLDQVGVVRQIRHIAKKEKVNGIWVLGDIYEKRLLDAITLLYGVQLIYELAEAAPVFLLPGNHDAHSTTSGRFLLEMFQAVNNKNITYLDGNRILSLGNADFFSLPWCPAGEAGHRIEQRRKSQKDDAINVLLLHHSVNGCNDGGWICDDGLEPDTLCEGWDLVFAGHFHDRQEFGDCGEYVGAPMQHNFGDAGAAQRGVRLVEFGKGGVHKSFCPIKAPRFHSTQWTVSGIQMKGWSVGDYVRVDVPATHAEWKAKRPEVEAQVEKLRTMGFKVLDPKHVPLQQVEERLPVGPKVTDEEVVAKYLDLANTEGLDRQLLMDLGLSVLQEVSDG